MKTFIKKWSWRLLAEPLAIRMLDFYFFRMLQGRVVGSDHLINSPCILAFNHSSYLDWLLVYHLFSLHYGIRVFFLAKAKLNANPLWRACVRHGQAIVVDYEQKHSIRKALSEMQAHLHAGHIVGIFPEGTRSADGRLQSPQQGVAWLAIQAGVPIIPIALQGFYEAWPRYRRFPGIAHCTIRIGAPIAEPANIDRHQFTQELMVKLGALLAETD
jgi:1-acyl-sn-glycerol-3-phosphate acyltransferase